jgi:hypothetical protein
MSMLDRTVVSERLRFFNGQRLFASDLQDLEAFNREMRWLHNRSLHQPGIGSGFAVKGAAGAHEVSVGPGYALDALGREIVLTETSIEPVPPVAGDAEGRPVAFYLTVSYPSDAALETAETREGICLPRGAVRLRERPVLCWVRLERDDRDRLVAPPSLAQEIVDGWRIVLGQALVQECALLEPFCVAQRRSARPSAVPRIACGHACVDLAENAPVVVLAGSTTSFVQVTAAIETGTRGFCKLPCYYVRVTGRDILERYFAATVIDDPTAEGFHVRVLIGPLAGTAALTVADFLASLPADDQTICLEWLAIET